MEAATQCLQKSPLAPAGQVHEYPRPVPLTQIEIAYTAVPRTDGLGSGARSAAVYDRFVANGRLS
jgi:hypothetical protein